jgi:hypothetical protein
MPGVTGADARTAHRRCLVFPPRADLVLTRRLEAVRLRKLAGFKIAWPVPARVSPRGVSVLAHRRVQLSEIARPRTRKAAPSMPYICRTASRLPPLIFTKPLKSLALPREVGE